ncbi:MAG: glycosyl hydrolase, partial [Deltaproteobacteria bacterium]|nr:glycosyl hydrolase [Deltaproteobacteria bacterium]
MRARRTLLWCVAAALLAAAAGPGLAAAARAVNDLLLLPAVRSDRAASSMLLGVARAGARLVAVGEWGHILTSDDNGVTWAQASVPTSVTLTAADFPTPAKGWAVGHDGVVLHT